MAFDAYTALFPHPEISRLHDENEEPSYEAIEAACVQLNANAAAIHSNGGDGKLGHLVLTVGATEYQNLSDGGVAFNVPAAPPVHPVHPAAATGPQITEINRRHKEDVRIFKEYQNTDAALKHLLLKAVDDAYVCELKDATLGYAQITTFDLITHLRDRYGTIEPEMLEANEKRMSADWSPETPIAKLFKQIDDGIAYAKAGNDVMSDERIVRIALKIVTATGRLTMPIRDWRKKAAADKTWVNFKTHFSDAYKELKLTVTTGGAGMAANAATAADVSLSPSDEGTVISELAPAFNDLAAATAADRTAMANLAASQASDREEIAKLRAELAAARQALTAASTAASGTANQDGGRTRQRRIHYCWSHGFSNNPRHTSSTCRNKKEGHQDAATKDNRMGGSNHRDPNVGH